MASTPALRDDIITKTEYAYWQRNSIRHHRLFQVGKWLVFATLAGWLLFVGDIFLRVLRTPSASAWEGVAFLVVILMTLSIGFHFGTQYRTLAIASESIMRLKRGGMWETFLLTGVDARRVVVGKWWAVVRTLWRDNALLAGLRMGAVVGVGTIFNLPYLTYFYQSPTPLVPDLSRLIVAMLLIFPLTLLNGVFTTATGVTGGMLTNRREGAATPMALVVRMCALLTPILVMLVVGFYIIYTGSGPRLDSENVKILLVLGLILMDNGILVGAAIINPLDQDTAIYMVAALVGMIAYAVLTFAVLAIGQFAAYRQGMLSPKEIVGS